MKIKHDKSCSQIDSIEYETNFDVKRVNPQLVTTPYIKRVRISSERHENKKLFYIFYIYIQVSDCVKVRGHI